jgi:FkbM family methyltransferase
VDVGANVGTFSFALQPHCAEVYAFEPQRTIFNMLAGSVALNGWLNVYCIHAAVGDSHGSIKVPQFDYSQRCSFGSIEFGDEQREPLSQKRQDDRVEFVSLVPLDHWSFSRVDAIKIDVEGMELEVIRGAQGLISRHLPILLVEHGKTEAGVIRNALSRWNYRIRDLGGDLLALPETA